MSVLNIWPARLTSSCLVLFLVAPSARCASLPLKTDLSAGSEGFGFVGDLGYSSSQSPADTQQGSGSSPLPVAQQPAASGPGLTHATAESQSPPAQQRTVVAQQGSTAPPVGTAAAPYENPDGTPASRPAGAAIAPAKQRRVRSFAVRTALLVGAAIAVGAVAASSLSSPNRAH